MKLMRFALLCSLSLPAAAHETGPHTPPWQDASPWPDRIIVTVAGDPKTSFSVTWRTDLSATTARAEIVAAQGHSRFDRGAIGVAAVSQTVTLASREIAGTEYPLRANAGLEPVRYHSVTFTKLQPDTLYAYRVMGAAGHWSEWLQTRTAPAGAAPLKFLYFGDAQDGILSHWARVVRAGYAAAPDARFAIHAGDLVNFGGRDFEWAEWFKSVGHIHGMIPAIPVPGNHEYFDGIMTSDRRPVTALSALWRPQFELPTYPELPPELQETVYAVDYGDLIVAAINTMADQYFEAQARWLDHVLAASRARWRVVTMHHPLFELLKRDYPGYVETGPQRRELFLPVLRKHRVDLALQGHDHSYARGSADQPRGLTRGRHTGTVFITSSAGAKMYQIGKEPWAQFADQQVALQRQAENSQFFQVIAIDGDTLVYRAHLATGEAYDAFELTKVNGQPNRLRELPRDIVETRTFGNTPAYENDRWDQVPPMP
jgi:hypothetical protein